MQDIQIDVVQIELPEGLFAVVHQCPGVSPFRNSPVERSAVDSDQCLIAPRGSSLSDYPPHPPFRRGICRVEQDDARVQGLVDQTDGFPVVDRAIGPPECHTAQAKPANSRERRRRSP